MKCHKVDQFKLKARLKINISAFTFFFVYVSHIFFLLKWFFCIEKVFLNVYNKQKSFFEASRGPRYYLDTSAFDIFGKSVPIRNFKKW